LAVDIRCMRFAARVGGVGCLAAVAVIAAGCGGGGQAPNRALVSAGAKVVAESGCEACHRIGDDGNDGPGGLPRNQFNAVVAYLASLRGPGDAIVVPGAPTYTQTPLSPKAVCGPHYFAAIVAITGGAHASNQTKRQLAQVKQRLLRYCRAHGQPSP
jgi:hypothetical protein